MEVPQEDIKFRDQARNVYRLLVVLCSFLGIIICGFAIIVIENNSSEKEPYEASLNSEENDNLIENGIHVKTGFIEDIGLMEVIDNCTNCHSAKLVTQNRMSRERWLMNIRWMQETQNLWDLGEDEELIVDYLAKNYAPQEKGRRQALTNIDWYALED